MSNHINIRKDVPSGTVIINRPEKRNAVTREMIAELQEAFEDFHQERLVKAIILTGSGDAFCSGSDIDEIQTTAASPDCYQKWHEDTLQLKTLLETMLRFSKPIIAAVNGPVMGTGLAMMLASDLVIASDSAGIQFPESRLGLSHGMTAPLLAFRIGNGLANKMLLSSQTVDASQAKQLNLYHETVPSDFVWARCQEMAAQCAKGARESHQMSKQMLNETIGESMFTHLSIGAANLAAARTTDAAKEGIAAFLEKRDPDWDSLIRQS